MRSSSRARVSGTLNHVAMTVMMLRSHQIPIRGIVLNGRRGPSRTWRNRRTPPPLSRMVPGVRIVEVPYDPSGAPVDGGVRVSSDGLL